ASLDGLPAMLRKVPVAEAERLAAADQDTDLTRVPSPEMLTSLVARTANVRRIRRWRGLAAAAAVALVAVAGGAAVTNALQGSGTPATVTGAWHKTSGVGPAAGAHPPARHPPHPRAADHCSH